MDLTLDTIKWSGKAGETAVLGITREWSELSSQIRRAPALTVPLSTYDITATAKDDYQSLSTELVFGANDWGPKKFRIKTYPNKYGEYYDELIGIKLDLGPYNSYTFEVPIRGGFRNPLEDKNLAKDLLAGTDIIGEYGRNIADQFAGSLARSIDTLTGIKKIEDILPWISDTFYDTFIRRPTTREQKAINSNMRKLMHGWWGVRG